MSKAILKQLQLKELTPNLLLLLVSGMFSLGKILFGHNSFLLILQLAILELALIKAPASHCKLYKIGFIVTDITLQVLIILQLTWI